MKFDFQLFFPLTGKLNGLASVEFSAGIASFSDLSVDHEDKNYTLNFEAFTVAPSRYQFSVNSTPFDVEERVLELVITQQPGKACATKLSSGCCFKYNRTSTKGYLFKAARTFFVPTYTLLLMSLYGH